MKDKNGNVQPPYLGAAYYPEDWPEEEMDYDISMMKKAGITVAELESSHGIRWSRSRGLTTSHGFIKSSIR